MSRRPVFWIGFLAFLLTVTVDGFLISKGLVVLGLLLLIGTLMTFSSGMIWLIHEDDEKFHIKSLWVLIPLVVFGAAMVKVFQKAGVTQMASPEQLLEVGNLMMSRYQELVWLSSITLTLALVVASCILRGKTP